MDESMVEGGVLTISDFSDFARSRTCTDISVHPSILIQPQPFQFLVYIT